MRVDAVSHEICFIPLLIQCLWGQSWSGKEAESKPRFGATQDTLRTWRTRNVLKDASISRRNVQAVASEDILFGRGVRMNSMNKQIKLCRNGCAKLYKKGVLTKQGIPKRGVFCEEMWCGQAHLTVLTDCTCCAECGHSAARLRTIRAQVPCDTSRGRASKIFKDWQSLGLAPKVSKRSWGSGITWRHAMLPLAKPHSLLLRLCLRQHLSWIQGLKIECNWIFHWESQCMTIALRCPVVHLNMTHCNIDYSRLFPTMIHKMMIYKSISNWLWRKLNNLITSK